MTRPVIDLYAGPGGWDEGMRQIGITDVLGIEIEPNACATAEAAGHRRLRADVSTTPITDHAGAAGLVASPPCQAWSMAGKRKGEADRAKVHSLIEAFAAGSDHIGDGWEDPRSHHAAQPIRWVRELRPRWVCFEQVPPVLGLWQHAAEVLRRWGYSVWTGVLNAADYGVPQTRERAILIARSDAPAMPPVPTHAKDAGPADLFGDQRLPWVSMADALGWDGVAGFPRLARPGDDAVTIDGVDYRARDLVSADAPSQAVTEKVRSWQRWLLVGGPQANATARDLDEPAPTVFSSRSGNLMWSLRNGTQVNACTRAADEPAGTLFFGRRANDVSWVLRSRRDSPAWVAGHGERPNRPADEPAVAITGEAHRWSWGDAEATTSIRVTVQEAAVLQSFPADYPWQGSKTKQFLQVGNAVPPTLAAAVVKKATS